MDAANNEELTIKDLIRVAFLVDEDGRPLGVNGIEIVWEALNLRCQTHPEETKTDIFPTASPTYPGQEMTCLHAVLYFDVPIETVDAILGANPAAIHHTTDEGTALDIACSMGECSPAVIMTLARAEQTTPGRDNDYGSSEEQVFNPIWFAYTINRVDVIHALLSEYAHIVPKHAEPLEALIWNYPKNSNEDKDVILFLWLMAYDYSSISPEDFPSFHPVNALLRFVSKHMFKCDTGVIEILESMKVKCPQYFSLVDRYGLLPLHVLIKKNRWFSKVGARAIFDDDSRVEFQELNAGEIVRFLVQENQESAQKFFRGKTPLHLAIENGWPIDAILEAAPNAVNIQDVKSGLYPFQLAAIEGTHIEERLQTCEKNRLKKFPNLYQRSPKQRRFTDLIEVEQAVNVNLSNKLLRQNPSLLPM